MKRSIILLLVLIPLSVGAQQAILSLNNDTYDFGKIGELDGLVTTTFTFINTGSTPLVLTNVKATCGCTVAKYIEEPIAPNGQGWITVTYNPNGRPGKFSKTINIKSNAANGTIQKLHISGEVIPGSRGITKKDNTNNLTYTVQQGDNLAEIAKKYHVSVSEIAKVNYIKPSTILTVGQTLTLPQGAYLFQKNQVLSSMPAKSAMSVNSNPSKESIVSNKLTSVVDKEIPSTNNKSTNTYVLIIANEDYEFLSDVDYAVNDGKIFKEYCVKTLGIPERQIFYYENATAGKMDDGIGKMEYCLNNFSEAKGIVYYCGHGIPDEKTSQAYLIPTDGKATSMRTCYSLTDIYKTLSATKAQSITYFMDACFTGANKEGSMLVAARGVARAPKKEVLAGNTIVFSASSGDETAMTLNEEGHGLFTYYLLKKLQETKGEVTYGDLAEYMNQNVKKDAFLINEKPQTPVVATSPAVVNTWKTMKLK